MTFPLRTKPLCLALVLAGVLGAPAQAATPTSPTTAGTVNATDATPKPVKAKKKTTKTSTVKYEKGSAETTAERDRRLFRECKGRPNGGACLGYAS